MRWEWAELFDRDGRLGGDGDRPVAVPAPDLGVGQAAALHVAGAAVPCGHDHVSACGGLRDRIHVDLLGLVWFLLSIATIPHVSRSCFPPAANGEGFYHTRPTVVFRRSYPICRLLMPCCNGWAARFRRSRVIRRRRNKVGDGQEGRAGVNPVGADCLLWRNRSTNNPRLDRVVERANVA